MSVCTIPKCQQFAARYTTPPLCELHLDLEILVEYLEKKNIPLTLENAQDLLARCLAASGEWTLTPNQLSLNFSAYLQATKRAAVPTQETAALATPVEA